MAAVAVPPDTVMASAGSVRRTLLPASVQLYSTTKTVELSQVSFTQKQTRTENCTASFGISDCEAVLRRGNMLIMKISLKSELSGAYVVSLTFVPVHRPRERFGQFRTRGIANSTKDIWLAIDIPHNFPVGKYSPHLLITFKDSCQTLTYFHSRFIVILFNPWNREDDAYVDDTAILQECVIDDVGTVWRGTHRQMTPLLWEYGQYEDNCLEAALLLLQSLNADECRSAASVSRAVVARVNCRDGTGVLVGSYLGKHAGGMHPCRWNGSAPILQRFYRSRSPVRYGQCWVFAGVVVTVLRALGIASRCVTCYEAAHRSSKLMQVDRYFTADGDLVNDLNADRVWSYHVWCEAWMRRNDLPAGSDGWQALDACSPEGQCGLHRVGPCSVATLREAPFGEQPWSHDKMTILSEANSDIRYHRVTTTSANVKNVKCTLTSVQHHQVGVRIVTASMKRGTWKELTSDYRTTPNETTTSPVKNCTFEMITSDDASLGDDITLNINIRNNASLMRMVDGRVIGKAVYYTGVAVKNFMSMEFSGVVAPGKDSTVKLCIESKSYMKVLTEQCFLQFFLVAKIRETKQLYLKLHYFKLCTPCLDVECPATITKGSILKIRLKFKNILQSSLSRILFLVQAQSLCPQRETAHRRLVLPGSLVVVDLSIKAQKIGKFIVLASMHCDQLTDVRGWAETEVLPPS